MPAPIMQPMPEPDQRERAERLGQAFAVAIRVGGDGFKGLAGGVLSHRHARTFCFRGPGRLD